MRLVLAAGRSSLPARTAGSYSVPPGLKLLSGDCRVPSGPPVGHRQLELDQTFIGAHYLFQGDRRPADMRERMIAVVLRVGIKKLICVYIAAQLAADKDAAGEIAAPGDEMNGRWNCPATVPAIARSRGDADASGSYTPGYYLPARRNGLWRKAPVPRPSIR